MRPWTLLVAPCLLGSVLHAGQLADVQADLRKPEARSVETDALDHAGGCLCEFFTGFLDLTFRQGLADGCFASWERIQPMHVMGRDDGLQSRRLGEAILPFARIDLSWQDVRSDVEARDLRGELGCGPLAVTLRDTRYEESSPEADLDLVQALALLRLSPRECLEIDMGAGMVAFAGDAWDSGVGVTLPILYHPVDYAGIEFRPTWALINANLVSDYDLAVLAGWRYASLRAGYRWVNTPHEALQGPQVGVSLRW